MASQEGRLPRAFYSRSAGHDHRTEASASLPQALGSQGDDEGRTCLRGQELPGLTEKRMEGWTETGAVAWRRGLGPTLRGTPTPDPPPQMPTFSLMWVAVGCLAPSKKVEIKNVSLINLINNSVGGEEAPCLSLFHPCNAPHSLCPTPPLQSFL